MDEAREERDELAALERDEAEERRLQNERAADLEAEAVYWLTGERE